MTETTIIQPSNEEELAQLAQQIIFEPDDFNLLFARINVQTHRDQLNAGLKTLLKANDIEVIDISTDIRTENLLALVEQAVALRGTSNNEFCLSITGLDAAILRRDSNILNHLNFNRELFRAETPYPFVFWLSETALTRLAQIAPDFWAWRSGVFEFADDLKDSLAEFTLANGTRPTPNDLSPPNPLIPFIGREDIRQQLIERLAKSSETEPQIIGIIGLGGIGKSALAARIAHDAASLFPGGVLWLPLDVVNSLELYQQVLQAYGAPIHGPDPVKTLSEIKKLLRQYRPLLILDGADQYPMAETILNELNGLATILITSRTNSTLPSNTSLLSVSSLNLSEAVRLLSTKLNISEAELIQDKNLNDVIQKLCIKLEFLPLAIALAAGAIHSLEISPDELLQRLDDSPPSYSFVIEKTYNLLNQDQKSLLVLVAIDRGETIHINALTTVTSILESTNPKQTRLKILRNIKTLLNYAFIDDVQSERYQLHRLIRSFIKSQLSEQEIAEIEVQLLDYYLQYVKEYNAYTAEGYNALDEEFSNIRGSMDIAYELQRWSTVVQFARHLCDFPDGYLAVRGYWTELCERLEQGISAARLSGQKSNQAFLTRSFGNLSFEQGDYTTARQYYQSALELFQSEGDSQGETLTLSNLGELAQSLERYEEAEAYYQHALAINEQIGDRAGLARSLQGLGELAESQNRYEQAEVYYQQALAINHEIRDKTGQAGSLQRLGELARIQEMYKQAEEYYQQALAINHEIRDKTGQAGSLQRLGELARIQEMYKQAEEYYQQALAINHEIRDRRGQASLIHNLGVVSLQQNQLIQAEAYFQQALQIYADTDSRYDQARIYHSLGMVAQLKRQWAQAQAYYQQALEIKIEFNDRYSQANIYDLLGMVAQEQRQWTQAQAHYQQALEIKSELHDRNSQASTYEQLGRVAQAQHQQAQAQAYYQRALDISQNVITQPPVE